MEAAGLVTPCGRAIEEQVLGVTDQINSVRQLTQNCLDDLRRALDALAHARAD